MRIKPQQIVIAKEKVLNYLLVHKQQNDKSAFLEKIGFTINNYNELIEEIIYIATHNEATLSKNSNYGSLYKVEGLLKSKAVITIWLEKMETDQFIFITLYPNL